VAHLDTSLVQSYRKLHHVSDLTRSPDPIDEFGAVLHSLLDFLKKKNVAVVELGQPVLWKPQLTAEEYESLWFYVNSPTGPVVPPGSWLLREMTRYNSLQAAEARSFGFEYVDLDAAFRRRSSIISTIVISPKKAASGWPTPYFPPWRALS
jgi:hypothetical protein